MKIIIAVLVFLIFILLVAIVSLAGYAKSLQSDYIDLIVRYNVVELQAIKYGADNKRLRQLMREKVDKHNATINRILYAKDGKVQGLIRENKHLKNEMNKYINEYNTAHNVVNNPDLKQSGEGVRV